MNEGKIFRLKPLHTKIGATVDFETPEDFLNKPIYSLLEIRPKVKPKMKVINLTNSQVNTNDSEELF